MSLSAKKRKKSKGLSKLDALNNMLGIDSTNMVATKEKKVRMQTRPLDTIEYNEDRDGFFLVTEMTKYINTIYSLFDLWKSNVEANVHITTEGMKLFTYYSDKTVVLSATLGIDLFSEYKCEREITFCVNLAVFAKNISTLQKFKPQKLTFSDADMALKVMGYPENAAPGEVVISSLPDALEELNTDVFNYDVFIRVSAQEFGKYVDSMPAVFSLRMDCDKKCLTFEGKDTQSRICLRLKIDDDIISEILGFPNVVNYKAVFLKSCLTPIVKSTKLSDFAIIAFDSSHPLFVRYNLHESADMKPENNSQVSMYFAPKFDNCSDDEE